VATDKRDKQKENIQNVQQPQTAPVPGIEGAYYGDKPLAKCSPSYVQSTQLSSAERPAKPGGILETQKEVGANTYPGRPLPPVETVKDAECKTGVAKKCVETQTEWNRHEKKG
jgi:hypothetical protein